MSNKPYIITGIIVLVLLAAFGFYARQAQRSDTASPISSLPQNLQSPPTTTIDDTCDYPITSANTWAVYTNTAYGFTLALDDAWEGYTTTTSSVPDAADGARINFDLPSSSTTPAAEAFSLDIVPVSDWRYLLPLGGPSDYHEAPTFIGSSSQYIFGYYFTDSPPPEIVSDYRCEVTRVLETFHLISR